MNPNQRRSMTLQNHSMKPTDREQYAEQLEVEVMRQWLAVHEARCGVTSEAYPHEGECQWPLPASLARMSAERRARLVAAAKDERGT